MSISVTIDNTAGTPNLTLQISVVGTAIVVNPATDVVGNLATTWQQLITALNADPSVTALVSMTLVGSSPTNIVQPGNCVPTPICTLSDETGNGIKFTALTPTTSLTLTFKGMKVYVPNT